MTKRFAQATFAKATVAVGLLTSTGVAQAHPGHDHGHWFSDINHALFYIACAAVIGTGAMLYKARRNAKTKGDHQE